MLKRWFPRTARFIILITTLKAIDSDVRASLLPSNDKYFGDADRRYNVVCLVAVVRT
jgi:hypothetical protein